MESFVVGVFWVVFFWNFTASEVMAQAHKKTKSFLEVVEKLKMAGRTMR